MKEHNKKEDQASKEVSSLFQREGVNPLLGDLSRKYPPQFIQVTSVLLVLLNVNETWCSLVHWSMVLCTVMVHIM